MNGFIFAVGNLDHPVAAVGNNPHAANLNQTTIAKLKLTAVMWQINDTYINGWGIITN